MLKTSKVVKSDKFFNPDKLIITLHGYGTRGSDFAEIGEIFLKERIDNSIFLFPDGPESCDMGIEGFQWFSLDELNYDALRKGLSKTAPILKKYIESKKQEYNCNNVYLVGFSQGSIMALEMIYHIKIEKILVYSGLFAMPLEDKPISKPDVLIMHSDDDPVVPYSNAKRAENNLLSLGINANLRTFHNIGHSISAEEWEIGSEFLK